jgi:hypothetical protein
MTPASSSATRPRQLQQFICADAPCTRYTCGMAKTDVVDKPIHRALSAASIGALAIGATAIGAVAVGALAIGRLAIGRLIVRRSRIETLTIGHLTVDRLSIRESLKPPI